MSKKYNFSAGAPSILLENTGKGMLTMSKTYTIGIIAFDGVLTSEIIGPVEVFATACQRDWFSGSKVLLIGVEPQPTIRTEEGLQLTVDATIADDLALDVLLVPGGNDVSHLLQHEPLNAFIRKHEESAEWLGSFCAGAFVLGGSGVLDGKQATTWFGGENRLQAQFPAIHVVNDQPVVLDQRRITANGGLVSYRASLVLLGQLVGLEKAAEIYRSLGMGRLGTWADIEATIQTVN
jgi:transcriptional regulator GlxA family with amidase domain